MTRNILYDIFGLWVGGCWRVYRHHCEDIRDLFTRDCHRVDHYDLTAFRPGRIAVRRVGY